MRRYRKGQTFRPPTAEESAAAADAMESHRRAPEQPQHREVQLREPDILFVRDDDCENWTVGDVVELGEVIISPAVINPRIFFKATTPATDGTGRIAIVVAPLSHCRIGEAVASGTVQTRVSISDTAHQFATVAAGSRTLVSSSDPLSPCQILYPVPGSGSEGTLSAVVRISNVNRNVSLVGTTTTAAELVVSPVCTGTCKWLATVDLTWTLDNNGCGTATPPTTTTAAPTTTTTSDCESCDPEVVATTTTAGPTTTTTAAECDCLYPTFCPTVEGQCTYTQCTMGAINSPPDCGPTTTTSCDCGSVSDPCGSTNCQWIAFNGQIRLVTNGCPTNGDCRCQPPVIGLDCTLVDTPCLLPPVDGTPPCEGSCLYQWIGALDVYLLGAFECTDIGDACTCQPPSSPPCASDECCAVLVPCISTVPTTSTTVYSHCERICYGEPTTTTTAADVTCATGGCQFIADGTTAWIGPLANDCPASCPCDVPPRDPLDTCEVYQSPCVTPPPPTTTTTVVPPTTTTTCCPDDMGNHYARYTCDGATWQISVDCGCPEGFEPYAGCPAALGTCGGFNAGQVGCCLCVVSPTTTTTAATTTSSTTTTTTAPPTTTSTSCEACDATIWNPVAHPDEGVWQCFGGTWTLCDDTCDPGYEPADPSDAIYGCPAQPCVGSEEDCAVCISDCVAVTTTTTAP